MGSGFSEVNMAGMSLKCIGILGLPNRLVRAISRDVPRASLAQG